MKKSLSLALLLLPLFATAAVAAPAPSEGEFLQSLAAPAACATELAPAALAGRPAPEAKVTGGCHAGFCRTSADCPCTTGAGSCTGGTCHYSTGGGGTGGGGGVSGCPGAFCTSTAQCLANCSTAHHSYCGPSGTCVYVL